jgi:hypothetical protein
MSVTECVAIVVGTKAAVELFLTLHELRRGRRTNSEQP